MEAQPSDSGTNRKGGGTRKRVEEQWTVVMEGKKKKTVVDKGSSLIKGGLGYGEQNLAMKYVNPGLTPAQFLEFQQQVLIFEHMKAGLPVPLHLVIPVWSKDAKSCGIGQSRHRPVAGLGPQKVDHRSIMDPEIGRCRRTDGNKWRCKKNVVPNQKYCERHMHRGCQRSRKHVEASEIPNTSGTKSTKDSESLKTILIPSQNALHPQMPFPYILIAPGDLKHSKTIPPLSQVMIPSSSNTSNVTITTTNGKDGKKPDSLFLGDCSSNNVFRGRVNSPITVDVANDTIATPSPCTPNSTPIITNKTTDDSNNDFCDCVNSAARPILIDTVAATSFIPSSNAVALSFPNTGPSFTTSNTITTSNINNKKLKSVGVKRDGSSSTSVNNMNIRRSKSGNSGNVRNSLSSGFSFSPKSVLQVIGCRGSGFYRIDVELEPGRCRRTDGKKWRCSQAVVPNQKYCKKHMHRGAKKRVEASHAVASLTTTAYMRRTMITSHVTDSATPNTILSISIPESPQLTTNDGKSSSSCSSDATISDTTITAN